MLLNFRQGLVRHQIPTFFNITFPTVDLIVDDTNLTVSFAAGDKEYLHTEQQTVPHAWGPITLGRDQWLYWDLNTRTGKRTFGITIIPPIVSPIAPTSVAFDQHWFDLSTNTMKVWGGHGWVKHIRTFAFKLANGRVPVSLGPTPDSFIGTQVGITAPTYTGHILFDATTTNAVRDSDGSFVTTEDQLSTQTISLSDVKLASIILEGEAQQNMAAHTVVVFSEFGKIVHADQFTAEQTRHFGMIESAAVIGQTVQVTNHGMITSQAWDWTSAGVNALLYCDTAGALTTTPVMPGQLPIGEVLDKHTIILGSPIVQASGGADVSLATQTVFGISRLSVPAEDDVDPIVVGDNDPRLTNARPPAFHTHPIEQVIQLQWELDQFPHPYIVKNVYGDYTLNGPDKKNHMIRISTPRSTVARAFVPNDDTFDAPVGSSIIVSSWGSGIVELTGTGGAVVHSPQSLRIDRKYGRVVLIKVGPNEWEVDGQLVAQVQFDIIPINMDVEFLQMGIGLNDPTPDSVVTISMDPYDGMNFNIGVGSAIQDVIYNSWNGGGAGGDVFATAPAIDKYMRLTVLEGSPHFETVAPGGPSYPYYGPGEWIKFIERTSSNGYGRNNPRWQVTTTYGALVYPPISMFKVQVDVSDTPDMTGFLGSFTCRMRTPVFKHAVSNFISVPAINGNVAYLTSSGQITDNASQVIGNVFTYPEQQAAPYDHYFVQLNKLSSSGTATYNGGLQLGSIYTSNGIAQTDGSFGYVGTGGMTFEMKVMTDLSGAVVPVTIDTLIMGTDVPPVDPGTPIAPDPYTSIMLTASNTDSSGYATEVQDFGDNLSLVAMGANAALLGFHDAQAAGVYYSLYNTSNSAPYAAYVHPIALGSGVHLTRVSSTYSVGIWFDANNTTIRLGSINVASGGNIDNLLDFTDISFDQYNESTAAYQISITSPAENRVVVAFADSYSSGAVQLYLFDVHFDGTLTQLSNISLNNGVDSNSQISVDSIPNTPNVVLAYTAADNNLYVRVVAIDGVNFTLGDPLVWGYPFPRDCLQVIAPHSTRVMLTHTEPSVVTFATFTIDSNTLTNAQAHTMGGTGIRASHIMALTPVRSILSYDEDGVGRIYGLITSTDGISLEIGPELVIYSPYNSIHNIVSSRVNDDTALVAYRDWNADTIYAMYASVSDAANGGGGGGGPIPPMVPEPFTGIDLASNDSIAVGPTAVYPVSSPVTSVALTDLMLGIAYAGEQQEARFYAHTTPPAGGGVAETYVAMTANAGGYDHGPHITKLSSTRALMLWHNTSPGYLQLRVVTTNGDAGPVYEFQQRALADNDQARDCIDITAISETIALLTISPGINAGDVPVETHVFEIDAAGAISYLYMVYPYSETAWFGVTKVTAAAIPGTNSAVVAYSDDSDYINLHVFTPDVANGTIAVGPVTQVYSMWPGTLDIAVTHPTQLIMASSTRQGDRLDIVSFRIAGTTITEQSHIQQGATNISLVSICALTPTRAVLGYVDSNQGNVIGVLIDYQTGSLDTSTNPVSVSYPCHSISCTRSSDVTAVVVTNETNKVVTVTNIIASQA